MIDYINTHQAEFWFFAGFGLLVIDALVLGFGSGVVLFAGIGGLLTGTLMYWGILPQTWLVGIASFGICSGVVTALLWGPLKRFQGRRVPAKDNSSDLIGHRFTLEQDVTRTAPGTTRYSGIEWRVELDDDTATDSLTAGTRVAVSSVDAGVFRVKAVT